MPNYTFRNVDTNETVVEFMKYSEIDEFLEENPHLERGVDTPMIINHNLIGVKGVKTRPDDGFREVLQKAKAAHPLGNINTF